MLFINIESLVTEKDNSPKAGLVDLRNTARQAFG